MEACCAFLPDRGLAGRVPEVAALLEEELLGTLPDLVFVPSPVEVHPDHRAVAEAFLSLFCGDAGRRLAATLEGRLIRRYWPSPRAKAAAALLRSARSNRSCRRAATAPALPPCRTQAWKKLTRYMWATCFRAA